jgi:hypothetical protein
LVGVFHDVAERCRRLTSRVSHSQAADPNRRTEEPGEPPR